MSLLGTPPPQTGGCPFRRPLLPPKKRKVPNLNQKQRSNYPFPPPVRWAPAMLLDRTKNVALWKNSRTRPREVGLNTRLKSGKGFASPRNRLDEFVANPPKKCFPKKTNPNAQTQRIPKKHVVPPPKRRKKRSCFPTKNKPWKCLQMPTKPPKKKAPPQKQKRTKVGAPKKKSQRGRVSSETKHKTSPALTFFIEGAELHGAQDGGEGRDADAGAHHHQGVEAPDLAKQIDESQCGFMYICIYNCIQCIWYAVYICCIYIVLNIYVYIYIHNFVITCSHISICTIQITTPILLL